MKPRHPSFSRTDVLFVTAVFIFGSVPFAHAWNGPGHMLVADIAWLALAAYPTVRNKLKTILRNASGGFEPAGTSEEQTRDAFGYAATFPDAIKTPDSTDYEQLVLEMNNLLWDDNTPEPGAGNEGVRCKSWHFYDTPINVPEGLNPHVFSSNLIKAWNAAVENLNALVHNQYHGPHYTGFDNNDLKFWWLAWMLHMAGDAHQPLHCVSNYAISDHGDAGGNSFHLNGQNKLHGYWDGLLVRTASNDGFHISGAQNTNGSSSALLSPVSEHWSEIHPATEAQRAVIDMADWVAEAVPVAHEVVYHGIEQGQAPSNNYNTAARAYARAAAVRGGQRLADALVRIFS